MHEGWLVDPGANWVWRFRREDKAWVRDLKVFMDRGMPMPNGEPPLLKERRHVHQDDAETMWRSLKSMGWKRSEPLWRAYAEHHVYAFLEQSLSPEGALVEWGGEGLGRSREVKWLK